MNVDGCWFESHLIPAPLNVLSHDNLAIIIQQLPVVSIVALANTCQAMHKLFSKCLDMILHRQVEAGIVALLPIVEHKYWINRIRVHVPDFELIPADYIDSDEHPEYFEDDLTVDDLEDDDYAETEDYDDYFGLGYEFADEISDQGSITWD